MGGMEGCGEWFGSMTDVCEYMVKWIDPKPVGEVDVAKRLCSTVDGVGGLRNPSSHFLLTISSSQ